jgi:type I restriction enzyme S subunit
MIDWHAIKLKDLCDKVTVGYVGPMADQYLDSGVTFLRSLNIKPFRIDLNDVKFVSEEFHHQIRKSALRPGDVAVVRTGYPGTAAVVPNSLPISNCSDLVIVRPGKDLNPHFITAIFNSTFGQTLVSGNTVGAAQQHFNITVAKELRFRVPSRKVQDKIAAILSAYDELIEVNRRRIGLLEKLAEELYREWFVRLRFPGHEKAQFKVGQPIEWSPLRVAKVIRRLKFGRIYRQEELQNDGCVCVIDQSTDEILGFYDGEPEHTATVDSPVLLFGDHTCKMVFMTKPFSLAENVVPFVPQSSDSSAYFLFHLVRDLTRTTEYKRHWTELTTREVLVPGTALQQQFETAVKPLHEQRSLFAELNRCLTRTRDLLLPRLISGKLRVEDLDIAFPPGMASGVA